MNNRYSDTPWYKRKATYQLIGVCALYLGVVLGLFILAGYLK